MSNDLDKRHEKAIAHRKELDAKIQRLQGKKEAAEQAYQAARKACEDKNIDPDKIDELLKQLGEKYESLVSNMEEENARVEEQLKPFLNK